MTPPPIAIHEFAPGDTAACEAILRALPDWFGIESALVAYVESLSRLETTVADSSGDVVGFLGLDHRTDAASEIHVIAIAPTHRGRGIGRLLTEDAERRAIGRGSRLMQVKTLGPSRPDEHYAQTRAFYARLGYVPLEENRLWGEANPCLQLVKPLASAADAATPPWLERLRTAPVFLASCAVQLVVPDVVAAAEHYRDALGLTIDGYFDDPPRHAIVSRDLVEVFLGRGDEAGISNRSLRDAGIDAYLRVRGLKELEREFRQNGADILEGPVQRSYGMRELVVRDHDGFVLAFAEGAAEAPAS